MQNLKKNDFNIMKVVGAEDKMKKIEKSGMNETNGNVSGNGLRINEIIDNLVDIFVREISFSLGKGEEVITGNVNIEKAKSKAGEEIMDCVEKMESGVLMLKTWIAFEKIKDAMLKAGASYLKIDFFVLFVSKPNYYDYEFYSKDCEKVVSAECLKQLQMGFEELDELYGKMNTDDCLRKSVSEEICSFVMSKMVKEARGKSFLGIDEHEEFDDETFIDLEGLNRFHKELNEKSYYTYERASLSEKISSPLLSKSGLRL